MNIKRIIRGLSHPLASCDVYLEHPICRRLSDKAFIQLRYFFRLKKRLNLRNPKTFNEKMQYLKLYYRHTRLTAMVDKCEAKKIVADAVGEEYIIPLLGVWNSFDEIDFSKLPQRFVLKTTHDCGGVVICRDKSTFDYGKAREFLNTHLKNDYYLHAREWPYKNVPHRIIAEEFVENPGEECLVVYKVFNFNGEPTIIQVIQGDKTKNESIDYFDREWNLLDLRQNFPNSRCHMKKPVELEKMVELSHILSEGMPFVRTDWYVVGGKLKFSEFTMYSDAGFAAFDPESWDDELGKKIDLTVI